MNLLLTMASGAVASAAVGLGVVAGKKSFSRNYTTSQFNPRNRIDWKRMKTLIRLNKNNQALTTQLLLSCKLPQDINEVLDILYKEAPSLSPLSRAILLSHITDNNHIRYDIRFQHHQADKENQNLVCIFPKSGKAYGTPLFNLNLKEDAMVLFYFFYAFYLDHQRNRNALNYMGGLLLNIINLASQDVYRDKELEGLISTLVDCYQIRSSLSQYSQSPYIPFLKKKTRTLSEGQRQKKYQIQSKISEYPQMRQNVKALQLGNDIERKKYVLKTLVRQIGVNQNQATINEISSILVFMSDYSQIKGIFDGIPTRKKLIIKPAEYIKLLTAITNSRQRALIYMDLYQFYLPYSKPEKKDDFVKEVTVQKLFEIEEIIEYVASCPINGSVSLKYQSFVNSCTQVLIEKINDEKTSYDEAYAIFSELKRQSLNYDPSGQHNTLYRIVYSKIESKKKAAYIYYKECNSPEMYCTYIKHLSEILKGDKTGKLDRQEYDAIVNSLMVVLNSNRQDLIFACMDALNKLTITDKEAKKEILRKYFQQFHININWSESPQSKDITYTKTGLLIPTTMLEKNFSEIFSKIFALAFYQQNQPRTPQNQTQTSQKEKKEPSRDPKKKSSSKKKKRKSKSKTQQPQTPINIKVIIGETRKREERNHRSDSERRTVDDSRYERKSGSQRRAPEPQRRNGEYSEKSRNPKSRKKVEPTQRSNPKSSEKRHEYSDSHLRDTGILSFAEVIGYDIKDLSVEQIHKLCQLYLYVISMFGKVDINDQEAVQEVCDALQVSTGYSQGQR